MGSPFWRFDMRKSTVVRVLLAFLGTAIVAIAALTQPGCGRRDSGLLNAAGPVRPGATPTTGVSDWKFQSCIDGVVVRMGDCGSCAADNYKDDTEAPFANVNV